MQVLSGAPQNALSEPECPLLSSRGPGSIWNYLGALVRPTAVSGRYACRFRTDLNFADMVVVDLVEDNLEAINREACNLGAVNLAAVHQEGLTMVAETQFIG
jgi:hypothetical protein